MASQMSAQPAVQSQQTPIVNNENPLIGNLSQIKNMINMAKSFGSEEAFLQNLVKSNPSVKPIVDLIGQHGGDARAAFYDLAAQKGVDPNSVLALLR